MAFRPFVALDLSSARVGWCYWNPSVDAPVSGAERLPGETTTERLNALGAWLFDTMWQNFPAASLLVIETPDMSQRIIRTTPTTLRALYKAAGICQRIAQELGIDFREVDPRLVRERIVGKETASKKDVQVCLHRRGYSLPMNGREIDHDAADAIALAVCVADEWEYAARLGEEHG